jgi:uncharacterized membrane protein
MANDGDNPGHGNDTGRLDAFSDGVFTIAITLLSLDLLPPALNEPVTADRLVNLLADRWPTYVAFVSSFATILIMWINHHAIFRLIQRTDMALKLANGFLLLLVTVVPFPTAMISIYFGTPAESVAAAVYAALFAVLNLAFVLLWQVARRHRLLGSDVSDRQYRPVFRVYLWGGPLYLLATALAFWNAYLSLAMCFALWILWAYTGRAQTAARE